MSIHEATATHHRYDADALAWNGDRQSYLALPEDTRRLLDGIADYLEEAHVSDTGLHAGCHWGEECEAETELEELIAALGEHLLIGDEDKHPEAIGQILESTIAELAAAAKRNEEETGKLLERARAEGAKDATIPSRANTAERKAMRLLIEGRLEVKRVDTDGDKAGLIVARCRGDSGRIYDLGYDPRPGQRRWRCTCEELRGQCSHLKALQLVTTIQTPTGGAT